MCVNINNMLTPFLLTPWELEWANQSEPSC